MFLYFTRSNGDIDCLPEKSVNDFKLTTKAKRRAFIGDSGADNFSLQDSVAHAVWDGSKYISDSMREKEEAIQDAEDLYLRAKKDGRIKVGEDIFEIEDAFDFDYQRKKGGNVLLKKYKGSIVTKTKQETDAIETALFNYRMSAVLAFNDDMVAIEGGDYSLTNLNNILQRVDLN